ncbi:MAG: hypothetical protein JXK94_05555 [Deltaproteobacteria bacterium]|nr:hypothetical protein [Deltaproteobacteria bacterium]
MSEVLARQTCVLIKPNPVNGVPPLVTLAVDACAALVKVCRKWSGAKIVIGEEAGDSHLTTGQVF